MEDDDHHLLAEDALEDRSPVVSDEERYSQESISGIAWPFRGACSSDSKQRRRSIVALTILALGLVSIILLLAFGLSPRYFHVTPASHDIDAATQALWGQPLLSDAALKNLANITKQAMSPTSDPCSDFYQYACGGWLDANPESSIPADRSSWSRSFSVIDQQNKEHITKILEDGWPLIETLFDDCLDTTTRNQLGIAPIQPLLDLIDQIEDVNGVFPVLGHLHATGVPGFLSLWVDSDYLNPDKNILNFDQGGYVLDDRDYYESDDPVLVELRAQYINHTRRSFVLLGYSFTDATTAALDSFNVEATLAHYSALAVEREDLFSIYNKGSFSSFFYDFSPTSTDDAALWQSYLTHLTPNLEVVTGQTQVVCFNPTFIGNLTRLLRTTPLAQIKSYLKWMVVYELGEFLTTEFEAEEFRWAQALYGLESPPAPEAKCTSIVNSVLGQLVGRYFVMQAFTEQSKILATDLVNRIVSAFNQTITKATWITSQTTADHAHDKMNKLAKLIGYPDQWPDYSQTVIRPGFYAEGVINKLYQDTQSTLSQSNGPADRSQWFMTPQTVNAYYAPEYNEIVFPAAILQPPFFNASWPAAMNFGGIGMVMGHEVGHSTDNSGSQFDATGALNDWWDEESWSRFVNRTNCVKKLYDGFEVPGYPGLYLNGELTLGENIADITGLQTAYQAFQAVSQMTDQADEKIKELFGLTNNQLFFVGFAQTWCTRYRPAYLHFLATTNPHSPAIFRVNGAVSQHPDFASAFKCSATSKLGNPQCHVWSN